MASLTDTRYGRQSADDVKHRLKGKKKKKKKAKGKGKGKKGKDEL
jgi:hypothetical protein